MNATFAATLLDPALPCPPGLRAWNGSDPAVRLAVYRNNVISSLVDALADNCPVVRALVGDDFFRAMAAQFVRRSPPRSPVLALYGEAFPDFIAGFEPAASLPYLADMARLELARQRALHAADATALSAEAAQHTLARADAPGQLSLGWHPSLRLLRSRHAVASLWHAHQLDDGDVDAALAAVNTDQAEDVVLLRHDLDLLLWRLPPGGAAFVAASQDGADLDRAAACALRDHPGFDLVATLAPLIAHGALTQLVLPRRPAP